MRRTIVLWVCRFSVLTVFCAFPATAPAQEAPAYLVKDFDESRMPAYMASLRPEGITTCGDLAFFRGGYWPGAFKALWCTDGTEAGTRMVKDLRVGTQPSSGYGDDDDRVEFACLGGSVFFSACDWSLGNTRLWKSDGTLEGTVLVGDPTDDYLHGANSPEHLTVAGDLLFFAVNSGSTPKRSHRIRMLRIMSPRNTL